MEVRDAAAKSFLSVVKRYGFDGRLWIWRDGLGGFRGIGRVSGNGESVCQLLTEEEIEVNKDCEPMMPTDVDPEDRPVRHRHKSS